MAKQNSKHTDRKPSIFGPIHYLAMIAFGTFFVHIFSQSLSVSVLISVLFAVVIYVALHVMKPLADQQTNC